MWRWGLSIVVLACACDEEASPPKLYPIDWGQRLIEARGCRNSPDHDLEFVSLWIDPGSQTRWRDCVDAFPEGGSTCTGPFPDGALFLKPQFDDAECKSLVRISVAQKDSAFAKTGGWHWQEVAVKNGVEKVVQDGALERCAGCHDDSDGFDQRCYMDPP